MSNAEIAHIWAQQSRDSKKCGNMSFRGRSLYSYDTEIARFIDGKVVRTTHRYSVTTTGKHYPACVRAITHLESYATSFEMREIPDSWEDVAPILFAEMMRGLGKSIEILRKARTRIAWSVERIAEQAHDVHRFYAAYIHNRFSQTRIDELTKDGVSSLDLNLMTAITADIKNVLVDRFGIDINSKIEKEKIAEEKANIKWKEKQERQEAERKLRQERRAIELKEDCERWRNGESVYGLYDVACMLRIKDDVIETSQGARVPIESAKLLWCAIERESDIKGFKIGDYTVTSIDAETLKIGCHNIPIPEVKMIAEKLGL